MTLWDLVAIVHGGGGPMGRMVKADTCPRCAVPRLYGLDGDTCALDAKVNPVPLSALGEVQATLASMRTFEIRRVKGGFHLDWRDRTHIHGRPAGSGVVDVLAEHRCGVTLDAAPPVLHAPPPAHVNAAPPF